MNKTNFDVKLKDVISNKNQLNNLWEKVKAMSTKDLINKIEQTIFLQKDFKSI